MTRNLLLAGDLVTRLSAIRDDSASAAWLDWRCLSEPFRELEQLSLFGTPNVARSPSQFGDHSVRVSTQLWRILQSSGHLFVLSEARVSHRVRDVLDQVFGTDQFRIEMPVALRNAPASSDRRPATSVIVYAMTAASVFSWSRHDDESLDRVYRHSEPETGRRYTLAACVRPHVDDPRFTYEWNGFRRTWRWSQRELDSLRAQGRIVLTRSGLPRLKRYYDEVSRRSTSWSSAWNKAGLVGDAPDAALAKLIVGLALNEGDVLIDASPNSTSLIDAASAAACNWIAIARDHQHAAKLRNELRSNDTNADEKYSLLEPRDLRDALALASANPRQFKYWVLGELGARFAEHQPGVGLHRGQLLLPSEGSAIPVFVDASRVTAANLRFAQRARKEAQAPMALLISPDSSSRLHALEQASARDLLFINVRELLSTRREELISKIERRLRERRPQHAALRLTRRRMPA